MGPTKPFEELYDTEADPWEIRNLAADPAHQADLARLRAELDRWQAEIIDLGFLNEADLRSRFGDTPPHDAVRSHPETYPFARLAETARLAASGAPADRMLPSLNDPDPSVRFWAIVGLSACRPRVDLSAMLDDPSPFVRVAAARSLARPDDPSRATSVLLSTLRDPSPWIRLQAADAIDQLRIESTAARDALSRLAEDKNEYVRRVVTHALGLPVAN
jgi:HEAT repeat protein